MVKCSKCKKRYAVVFVTKIEDGEYYVCANSNDALDRPLSTYEYASLRIIQIKGVRYDTRFIIDCFDSLYSPNIEEQAPPSSAPNNEE